MKNLKNLSGNKSKDEYKKYGIISMIVLAGVLVASVPFGWGTASALSGGSGNSINSGNNVINTHSPIDIAKVHVRINSELRRKAAISNAITLNLTTNQTPVLNPGGIPDYFDMMPNYAFSQLPSVNQKNGATTGGIRKFKNTLPGLGPAGANDLGQYIPIAVADTKAFPGADYYEIALVQYTEKMHSDLNPTTLRGYVQISTKNVPGKMFPLMYPNGTFITNNQGQNVFAVDKPHYLGPLIIAQRNRPVRVKFTNYLPTGTDGNLFIPVDTAVIGAGIGPNGTATTNCNVAPNVLVPPTCYAQNRGTIHLHGGNTPWISDGTQDEWTTPAGQNTNYPIGVSTHYVPDMDGGTEPVGTMTFYYTNQQSARLMFYHDHVYGITRLNVYAGIAAAYIVQDPVEQTLVNGGVIPGTNVNVPAGTIPAVQIPLVIQDKTFLPDPTQLALEDPTWPFNLSSKLSNLWFPHVYMPNQNPAFGHGGIGGENQMGRWDYGPWLETPVNSTFGPVPNPLFGTAPWENKFNPGTSLPSITPEAFVDTPVINGNAYPILNLGQQAYRFRILDAANDRGYNLQLYYASTAGPFVQVSGGNGSGASAAVTVNSTGSVTSVTVTSGGAGYTSAPTVKVFDVNGHNGSGAVITAQVDLSTATVIGMTIVNGGSGYSVPTICKGPAAPAANLCTEISMVPAVPGAAAFPPDWNTSSILDGRVGGIPDPAAIGPSMIQIGNEAGFLPAAVTLPNRPVGFDYTNSVEGVLNVKEKALFMDPAERADVVTDFSGVPNNSTLILYNDAPTPVTGADPRYDFFTNGPDNTIIGGAPSTLPGYGPNIRTIMQIRINASLGIGTFNATNLTKVLPVAYANSQDKPLVPESAYNTAFNASFSNNYVGFNDTSLTFTPVNSTSPVTINLTPKSIDDGFDILHGGLYTTLGVALPSSPCTYAASTGVTDACPIPYNQWDPPTEIIKNSNPVVQIGTMADGTQIWRIFSNSVDTHPMHWHMFNVEVINRVSQLDGSIRPPDPNELGWREVLRVNPLEDTIIALRPIKPIVPWDLPNNIRPLDVTAPLGSNGTVGILGNITGFESIDPTNKSAPVTNILVNFGEEYVWHCHILGHEESSIMRPMAIVVTSNAPANLVAKLTTSGVNLTWTDNSTNEINWIVQISKSASGPWTTIATIPSTTGPTKGSTVTITDGKKKGFFYRILAENIVGDTTVYPNTAGYPNMMADSLPSNIVSV
jgi:FtsP/CotA-like multicopper oxidase with cupredoxin domain